MRKPKPPPPATAEQLAEFTSLLERIAALVADDLRALPQPERAFRLASARRLMTRVTASAGLCRDLRRATVAADNALTRLQWSIEALDRAEREAANDPEGGGNP